MTMSLEAFWLCRGNLLILVTLRENQNEIEMKKKLLEAESESRKGNEMDKSITWLMEI